MTLSRRDLLKLGAGAGLTAAAGGLNPLLGERVQTSLRMKTIPSSGQRVPAIGIGCRNYRASSAALQARSGQLDPWRGCLAL